MPSSCGVFRGADKLEIGCSVALCATDFLGYLRLQCQFPYGQQISWDASVCDVSYPECSGSSGMVSPGEQTS